MHCELAVSLLKTVNNSLSPFYTSQPLEKNKLKMLLEISSLSAILGKECNSFSLLTACKHTSKMAFFKRKQLLAFYISVFTLFTQDCLLGNDISLQLRKRKYIEKWYS